MELSKTFAKARNANYIAPLAREVKITDIPSDRMAACQSIFGGTIASHPRTKWIDAEQLAALDAGIDQTPWLRRGTALPATDPAGHPGISPHAIYGVDAAGRSMGSATIYRVYGGAMITFEYM
jgi:hypothetical protein